MNMLILSGLLVIWSLLLAADVYLFVVGLRGRIWGSVLASVIAMWMWVYATIDVLQQIINGK